MSVRSTTIMLTKLAGATVLLCTIAGGAASATPAVQQNTVTENVDSSQISGWTPIAAYATYWECASAASSFPGYAYCSHYGGSFPWILWVWTW